MRLLVNGKDTEVEAGATLKQLLEQMMESAPLQGIAVAVNDAVVPRDKWEERELREGDRLEIIRAVQGG